MPVIRDDDDRIRRSGFTRIRWSDQSKGVWSQDRQCD